MRATTLIVAVALALATTAARAQAQLPAPTTPDDSTAVRPPETLEDLIQRVRVLERKLELKQEEDAARAKAAPAIVVAGDGVAFRAADGSFQLRLRGYVQDDARMYQGVAHPGTSAFLLRRVRPILEATALQRYTLRIMPDFGNGQTVLYDAYVEAAFLPQLGLRFGKFKPPVGLERLQSATNLMFVERALPTALVPNRDLGVQLQGVVGGGLLSYALGVFNGVNDGGMADTDTDNAKEVAARLFAQPFQASESDALRRLGFGVAATRGAVHGTLTSVSLPSYSSPGQLAFFRYRADGKATGTAIASGDHVRLAPQGWYYRGPLSVLGEYVISRQAVALDTASATLRNRAWQVAAAYAVTGEDAGAKGIRPRSVFDPAKGSWGAIELTARVHQLRLDDDAFPRFADPTASARSARAWAAGLNWYLNPNVKLVLDYERTRFAGGAKTGDRAPERALFSRIQFAF